MTEVQIQPAGPEDAGAIYTLQRAAYVAEAQLYDDVRLPALTQTLDDLAAEVAQGVVLKAVTRTPEGELRLVGAVRARMDGPVMRLGRLVVAPDLQGRGIGTALLRAAQAQAPASVSRLALFTGHLSEANLRLYAREGYAEVAREQVRPGLVLVHLEKAVVPRPAGGAGQDHSPASTAQLQPVGPVVEGWTPRAGARVDVLHGRYCRLEALSPAHDAALAAALLDVDPQGRLWTYLKVRPFADPAALAAWTSTLRSDASVGPLVVVVTDGAQDDVQGLVCYLREDRDMGSIEVGSIVLGPRLQRTRAATEAMYLMARHVLTDLGYRRYEWKCDALNAPSRAAAQRLGFRYEGTFRQSMVIKGRNRDTAWFAMTDTDWTALSPAYEAWLAPSSFDGTAQRTSLSALTGAVLRSHQSPSTGSASGMNR